MTEAAVAHVVWFFIEVVHASYLVCRAERTILLLKFALCSLEAEENGSQKSDLSSQSGEEATKQTEKLPDEV